MTIAEVYVALLDEGINVWRPAPAHKIDEHTYVLLRPDDYDPEVEIWEFPPGTVVRCAHRHVRDGDIFTAVEQVHVPERQSA